MRPWNGVVTEFGAIVASTTDSDGIPVYQVQGFAGNGVAATGITAQSLLPYGFYCQPVEPKIDPNGAYVASTAATGMLVYEGDSQTWALPVWDPQSLARIPVQSPGSVGLACAAGSFAILDGKAGSYYLNVFYDYDGIAIPTDSRGSPQKQHSIEVNVDASGNEAINIIHGSGMRITMVAGGANSVVIANSAGDSYIEVSDNGIVLNGNVTVNGSLNTGNPEGAQQLAFGQAVVAAIQAIAAHMTGSTTAPPPELAALLPLIPTQNTQGT